MNEPKQKPGSKEEIDQTASHEKEFRAFSQEKEFKALLERSDPEQRLALLQSPQKDEYIPPHAPMHSAYQYSIETRGTLDPAAIAWLQEGSIAFEVFREECRHLYGDNPSAADFYEILPTKKRVAPQGITSIYGKSDSSDLYGDSSADDLYKTPKDTDTPKKREVPQGITSIYGKSDSSDLYRDCSADDLYDTSKEREVPQGNTSEKDSPDVVFRK